MVLIIFFWLLETKSKRAHPTNIPRVYWPCVCVCVVFGAAFPLFIFSSIVCLCCVRVFCVRVLCARSLSCSISSSLSSSSSSLGLAGWIADGGRWVHCYNINIIIHSTIIITRLDYDLTVHIFCSVRGIFLTSTTTKFCSVLHCCYCFYCVLLLLMYNRLYFTVITVLTIVHNPEAFGQRQ